MTRKEIAIEVATKIWKWERDARGPDGISVYYGPVDGPLLFEDKLEDEAFSWQGFGRTVEAMEKKGWSLTVNNSGWGFYNAGKFYEILGDREVFCTPMNWFDGVHNIALEIINENTYEE